MEEGEEEGKEEEEHEEEEEEQEGEDLLECLLVVLSLFHGQTTQRCNVCSIDIPPLKKLIITDKYAYQITYSEENIEHVI